MIKRLGDRVPRVHPSAFVSEFAYVVGDVEIGEGSSVWPGAVVRGDDGKVTVGSHTCIQDNSVVHGDADVAIGDRVVIGHRVMCHARVVGDGCLLGNGSTVNDGVEMGEGSVVASGAAVQEGRRIAAGSLVAGVPARLVGRVPRRLRERIALYGSLYAAKARRYKEQGDLE